MYVCIYICMYLHMYVSMYACMYLSMYVRRGVYTHGLPESDLPVRFRKHRFRILVVDWINASAEEERLQVFVVPSDLPEGVQGQDRPRCLRPRERLIQWTICV